MTTKDTNPKDAIGSTKLPVHLFPFSAIAYGCIGLLNGALKYGRMNWRAAGIRPTVYFDALNRHMNAWMEGEEVDPDDKVHHLMAAQATLAILIDAHASGTMVDDRHMHVYDTHRKMVDKLTPYVKDLKELHKEKNPKHYTIKDSLDKLDYVPDSNTNKQPE